MVPGNEDMPARMRALQAGGPLYGGATLVILAVLMTPLSVPFARRAAGLLALLLCAGFLRAQETQIQYLSGKGPKDAVPWDLQVTGGRRSGTWTTIAVPSNWEQQGFGGYNYGQEAAPIFAPLSPREVEILDNIAQGMTNKQVAYALSISEQTVKNHMSSILRKLSVNDRTQAVVYAMRQGWIRMPED